MRSASPAASALACARRRPPSLRGLRSSSGLERAGPPQLRHIILRHSSARNPSGLWTRSILHVSALQALSIPSADVTVSVQVSTAAWARLRKQGATPSTVNRTCSIPSLEQAYVCCQESNRNPRKNRRGRGGVGQQAATGVVDAGSAQPLRSMPVGVGIQCGARWAGLHSRRRILTAVGGATGKTRSA